MKRALLTALVVCVGCGHSPAIRLFTLAPTPASQRVTYGGLPVRLEAVHLQPSLAGRSMLHGTQTHEVDVRHLERWSDNLDFLMRQTLAQNLRTRLPEGALVFPDAPRPRGALSWVVNVLSLTEQEGELRCEASWSLLASEAPQQVERRQGAFSAKVDGTAESSAAALSQICADLADAMTASLEGAAASVGATSVIPSPSGT